MKKLVFAMLAVLGMSLTSCFGDKPATKENEKDSTVCALPDAEGAVDEGDTATDVNAEAGKAAVNEEKKEAPADDKAAPADDKVAPAENAENAEKK